MTVKDVLNTIEQRFKEGKTRGEIFNELSTEFKYRSELVQYVAMVPEPYTKSKYNSLNLVLFLMLILISVTNCVNIILAVSTSPLPPAISGLIIMLALPFAFSLLWMYFAVQVWKFRGNIYRIVRNLGIANFLISAESFAKLLNSGNGLGIVLGISLGIIPMVLIIAIAHHIGNNAFPYYNAWGRLKEDAIDLRS
jgi:hypothetical protein